MSLLIGDIGLTSSFLTLYLSLVSLSLVKLNYLCAAFVEWNGFYTTAKAPSNLFGLSELSKLILIWDRGLYLSFPYIAESIKVLLLCFGVLEIDFPLFRLLYSYLFSGRYRLGDSSVTNLVFCFDDESCVLLCSFDDERLNFFTKSLI